MHRSDALPPSTYSQRKTSSVNLYPSPDRSRPLPGSPQRLIHDGSRFQTKANVSERRKLCCRRKAQFLGKSRHPGRRTRARKRSEHPGPELPLRSESNLESGPHREPKEGRLKFLTQTTFRSRSPPTDRPGVCCLHVLVDESMHRQWREREDSLPI